MPQIRVLLGHQQGQVFALAERRTVIGRHPQADIVLHPDSAASRRHAEVYPESGRWWLRDLGSRNGTELNGRKAGDEELSDRDEIVIGDNVFVFEQKDADAAAIAEAASHANAGGENGVQNQPQTQALVHAMSEQLKLIEQEIGKVVLGNECVVRDLLIAMIGGGHVFLVGMPGLAKTSLVRAMADALQLKFTRIRCSPDLSPEDITGASVDAEAKEDARFVRGPIFGQVVLADEIHRASPKTQAVVLDAVQDREVYASGRVRPIDAPFLLVATESPANDDGSRPIVKTQLDRFMVSIGLDYPSEAAEEQIVKATTAPNSQPVKHVLTMKQLLTLQAAARDVPVCDSVVKYAVRLVRATRPADKRAPDFVRRFVYSGAGPRGAHFLILGAKAHAVICGRLIVTVDDVKSVARQTLRHRLSMNFAGESEGMDPDKIVQKLIAAVAEPPAEEG